MYYRKREEAQDIADRIGVGDLFRHVGDKVHMDDLPNVKQLLDVTDSGIDLLFEYEGEDAEIADLFEMFDDGKIYN